MNLNRFRKRVLQCSAPQHRWAIAPYRMTAPYGKQLFDVGTNFTCMNKGELDAIMALIPSSDDTTEAYIKSKKITIHISNQESTNVLIQIYHYSTRREENQGPGAMIDKGLEDLVAATTYTKETYGVTPFNSKIFCKTFRVQRMYALELGAGRSHIHTARWNINKILNKSVLTETDASAIWLPGWTQGIFIIARGEPVNEDAATPTSAQVTSSPVSLDAVVTEKTVFHYGAPYVSLLTVNNTLATTGLTNLVQMNEATGGETSVTNS